MLCYECNLQGNLCEDSVVTFLVCVSSDRQPGEYFQYTMSQYKVSKLANKVVHCRCCHFLCSAHFLGLTNRCTAYSCTLVGGGRIMKIIALYRFIERNFRSRNSCVCRITVLRTRIIRPWQ